MQNIQPREQEVQSTLSEVQQESLFCQLPQDILFLIAEKLCPKKQDTICFTHEAHSLIRKDYNNLCLTCKELDRRMTCPSKKINLYFMDKRGDDSCKIFLAKVLHLITRMAKKEGWHPISLYLANNRLDDDMDALQEFMTSCAQPPIVSKLKELMLGDNQLETLPPAITQLQYLEVLKLSRNNLKDPVIPLVSQLSFLNELDLGGNLIQTIDSKISFLQNLKILCLSNKLSKDSLERLLQLTKLERLEVSGMTIADIAMGFVACPHRLNITGYDMERGANCEEFMQQFKKTSHAILNILSCRY